MGQNKLLPEDHIMQVHSNGFKGLLKTQHILSQKKTFAYSSLQRLVLLRPAACSPCLFTPTGTISRASREAEDVFGRQEEEARQGRRVRPQRGQEVRRWQGLLLLPWLPRPRSTYSHTIFPTSTLGPSWFGVCSFIEDFLPVCLTSSLLDSLSTIQLRQSNERRYLRECSKKKLYILTNHKGQHMG